MPVAEAVRSLPRLRHSESLVASLENGPEGPNVSQDDRSAILKLASDSVENDEDDSECPDVAEVAHPPGIEPDRNP